ncbi:Holliday junction branch migration protein RuvA [Fundicoccus ignavus]|uniref:Holliday junction branch migration complex subunit RuvA n=1 Tax=Fundicoccus ignavus TaxID=2664442 RepID=A0A6I2GG98_9LACT|nr:Holliday junction branch migration protein RuvA [Fundicoccus ignavus]MRI80608.1 Holliday junction branch migration protein RuvA [Fundicoccus ignavus]MRI84842.1 Holliday junction branch migration protein RuvA [Fundicoccus ignavus]MRJ46530.1 Holliday junction branch migration protein RuvA [Fundicoccus ignavus]
MYEFIEGDLVHIHPTYLVLQANGIGYQLYCANPYRWQEYLAQKVKIFVELIVREDSMTLYGFKELSEKQLFLTLNKVSGIGPKSAMSILALDDHQGLVEAIEASDSKYLMKFPGVGKKTAQQMILDLQGTLDFAENFSENKVDNQAAKNKQLLDEVFEALLGLGYSQREIKRIEKPLGEAVFETTQEALSIAFKLLIK